MEGETDVGLQQDLTLQPSLSAQYIERFNYFAELKTKVGYIVTLEKCPHLSREGGQGQQYRYRKVQKRGMHNNCVLFN